MTDETTTRTVYRAEIVTWELQQTFNPKTAKWEDKASNVLMEEDFFQTDDGDQIDQIGQSALVVCKAWMQGRVRIYPTSATTTTATKGESR